MFVVLPSLAGPREFATNEIKRALAERGLSEADVPFQTKIVEGKPECYTVNRDLITGTDERGLMYGLLEAASQIRTAGHLSAASGCPAVQMRGIRYFRHNQDLEKNWYYSRDYWDEYFAMLARNRFNRFNLVFAHQTNYLAPPYPFWLEMPDFPEIRAIGLSAEQRQRDLEMLQYISQDAADHGIDFTLGVWEHNAWPTQKATVEGITRQNVGPYSYAALKTILQLCPAIRSVEMRTNEESGIPPDFRNEFYRKYVFAAIRDAGRPVLLDLRAWAVAKDMIDAAQQVGVPLRVSTKYWAEDVGRPYQPAETYPGYSYLNFLEKPYSYQFFWELWGLGSNRLLLWGNPEFVRRATSTFHLGDGVGFEIDAPLAQRGFGNRPGEWGIFTASQSHRVFWKWEFERYWLFYLLWGRLSYDPETPEAVWRNELRKRFGVAADEVLATYQPASRVINEIVAAHLADPNMYLWPEVNPGGLVDDYIDVLPSDWRYIASIPEAVANRLHGVASAKQTPVQTAELLDGLAGKIEQGVARAGQRMANGNTEWASTQPDFEVLALLARYHACKMRAAYQLEYFYQSGDEAGLAGAKEELEKGLGYWQKLVKVTDGVYPEQMAFGPDDVGHWKDRLVYVQQDLDTLREREEIFQRFGRFDYGFDFGAPVAKSQRQSYRATHYVLTNNVEPRFLPVDPATRYDEASGYGWASEGPREAVGIPLTPYLEVRSAIKDPQNLPHDVLYRDYIRGSGTQIFRVKAQPGEYKIHFLHPDRSEQVVELKPEGGVLNIAFPPGEWSVSGLVIQGPKSQSPLASHAAPKFTGRPAITHQAPTTTQAAQPLTLAIQISPSTEVSGVRLHYRPVNQEAKFKTIEQTPGNGSFTIPGEDISARWDLMYYFEVLGKGGSGWFQPDPQVATPYYVVKVQPGAARN
jgi:hypothetical protein